MTFGIRELSVIQTALQLKKRSMAFNKTWQKVHQDYQIGTVHGKELHLTSKELEYLERCIYAKQVKVAPEQSLNLESDRMDLLNFLKDENILKKIVSSSGINKDSLVIEIGCGAGALTNEIKKATSKY